ncbi:LPXTG cell wall anchor domain-containing protein [Micromonospora sp. NPDC049081]|uniref:LPXTG cell wall anchor domain-containing protein n=1 Tax=Micromonospora sp. NPDC049081 TaxID=3155150 RepID=UPI00340FA453
MLRHHLRRWFATFVAVGVFVGTAATPALAVGTFVSAAAAPTAAGAVKIESRNLLVAPGHGTSGQVRIDITHLAEGEPFHLGLDLSELDKVGRLTTSGDGWSCAQPDRRLRCTAKKGKAAMSNEFPTLFFQIDARSDAPLDTRVELRFDVTSSAASGTRTTTVTVVEGVDLQTAPKAELSVEPGDLLDVTGTVRNAGPGPERGVVLTMDPDWLLTYRDNFRNCRWREGTPLVCRFDTELEPGVTYRLSDPLPFRVNRIARSGLVLTNRLQWWTTDDWALVENDPTAPKPPDTPGNGIELRLVAQPSAARTDPAVRNSWTDVRVTITGDRTADAAAVGDEARVRVGDRVKMTIGFRNLGPTTVETWREQPLVQVDIPDGLTVVDIVWNCYPVTDGKWNGGDIGEPGAPSYGCGGPGDFADAGETFSYALTLRVDRLTRRTAGAVTTTLDGDTDHRNDRAEIVFLPAADGSAGGEPDGDGSLPITGGAAASLAALGGGLLVAGLGGYLVARRHRTRFVA